MYVWMGGRYSNDAGPLGVACSACNAKQWEPCVDTVDGVMKRLVHGERATAAGYLGPVHDWSHYARTRGING